MVRRGKSESWLTIVSIVLSWGHVTKISHHVAAFLVWFWQKCLVEDGDLELDKDQYGINQHHSNIRYQDAFSSKGLLTLCLGTTRTIKAMGVQQNFVLL